MAKLLDLTLIIGILSGVLPALFWLWFWLHEDAVRPEPKPLLGIIFIVGALIVWPAYIMEKWLVAGEGLSLDQNLWWLLTAWAVIEEGLKFIAVYLVALSSRYDDEPVDAMIYLLTAALGFSAVENTLFILSAGNGAGGLEYLLTANFRFLGATLVHIVASALVGAAVGLTFYAGRGRKAIAVGIGFTAAVLLHALFNYYIIKSGNGQTFKIFVLLWLVGLVVIFLFERVKGIIKK